jgi:hypothetical protein
MSDINAINAQLDLLNKAKLMVEQDARNQAELQGINPNDYDAQIAISQLNAKITELKSDKQKALEALSMDYNDVTNNYNFAIKDKLKSDMLFEVQTRSFDKEKEKLINISSDLVTIEKQIQLSENEFKKRSEQIFLLKSVFIVLSLTVGNLIGVRSQWYPNYVAYIIQAILVLFLGLMIYNSVRWDNKRSSTEFNIFNWQSPIKQETSSEEETASEELLAQTKKCITSEGQIKALSQTN